MLTPPDILSAKLMVQMGYAESTLVQSELSLADKDDDLSLDLVARLTGKGHLKADQVKRLRRYVALFDHVRREATYLRFFERRAGDSPFSREEIGALIARLEHNRYRVRLPSVLLELGRISRDEAMEIEAAVRKAVRREDLKVLKRYRRESFTGVARPTGSSGSGAHRALQGLEPLSLQDDPQIRQAGDEAPPRGGGRQDGHYRVPPQ